jgi:hypothetical protein
MYVSICATSGNSYPVRLVEPRNDTDRAPLRIAEVEVRELTIVNGVAGLSSSSPTQVGIGLFAAYDAAPERNLPHVGLATVNASYWPVPRVAISPGAGASASATLPIPSFVDRSSGMKLLRIVL